jgi:hypothetical protein
MVHWLIQIGGYAALVLLFSGVSVLTWNTSVERAARALPWYVSAAIWWLVLPVATLLLVNAGLVYLF